MPVITTITHPVSLFVLFFILLTIISFLIGICLAFALPDPEDPMLVPILQDEEEMSPPPLYEPPTPRSRWIFGAVEERERDFYEGVISPKEVRQGPRLVLPTYNQIVTECDSPHSAIV